MSPTNCRASSRQNRVVRRSRLNVERLAQESYKDGEMRSFKVWTRSWPRSSNLAWPGKSTIFITFIYSWLVVCIDFLVNIYIYISVMVVWWLYGNDVVMIQWYGNDMGIKWLVVTGTMEFYNFPYIGNVIIPTEKLHLFSRGVGIPPTR